MRCLTTKSYLYTSVANDKETQLAKRFFIENQEKGNLLVTPNH
jgi:hypothetical protein